MKPHLEELTQRILPSASPLPVVSAASPPPVPSVAAITSFVSSMTELRSQLLATIEQDLSNSLYTVGQVIAQEVSAVEQQVDQILGINPNPANQFTPSQPDSGAGRGNASGSGSGNGTRTASHNAPNQQLNNSESQNGSGSGSGSSATPAHKNGNKQGGPTVRPLTGSGSCNYNTTVQFGDTGYISTAEEVNCATPTIQVPIIVGNPGSCPVTVSYSTEDDTAHADLDSLL